MQLRFIAIVSIILFVSCATFSSNRKVSDEIEIPEAWNPDIGQGESADSLWWQDFNDENLDELVYEAFSNNHTFRIAAVNVQAAASQAVIAGAPRLPQLDASFNASRRKQNFIGFPIPGSEGRVLSNTNDSYGVSLNMSWELDLWSKLGAEEASALAQFQASQANYYGAKLSLTAQLCKAWFTAIEAKRQFELSEATLQSLQLSTDQVRLRYESGIRGSLDYRMSLASQANTEAQLKTRQFLYENAVRQLEILLGRYPSAELDIGSELPGLLSDVPVGLPSDLLTRRPDLVAAERSLYSADASIRSAKAALFPQFSLTGSAGTSSNQLKDLANGELGVWTLAGNVLQPLFQRGRLKTNVKLAKSNAELAYLQYAQAALNAFSEVENALANERYLQERQVSLETAVEQSIAARVLAEDQYASGLIDIVTMLEAQRSAFDNESQLLALRRERLDARIDLHLSLGGGFDKSLIENK